PAAATPPPLVHSPSSSQALQLFDLPSQTVPSRYSTGLPESDIPAPSLTHNKRKRSFTNFPERPPPPPPSALFVHQPPELAMAYLPRFNEMISKSRLTLQWLAESSGFKHCLRWHVDCVGKFLY
ncbi:MAG TPA: hypothetical protein VGO47_10575, partial [Chlamydiales bacterium]|nr:hypothetical protein [Chlamydiales bacterium]